ncbi:hypothetical protein D3C81_1970740 [compost metagenome]
MAAATERRCTQRTPHMVDHLLYSMLYLGTHTAHLEAGVGAGLAIYPRGTFA